jgi:hypothetical protein
MAEDLRRDSFTKTNHLWRDESISAEVDDLGRRGDALVRALPATPD